MNRSPIIGRLTSALAALAGALLALSAAPPAALAYRLPPPGGPGDAPSPLRPLAPGGTSTPRCQRRPHAPT